MPYFFVGLDENEKIIWNFEKISKDFGNFSTENCKKCIILHIFQKQVTNHALIFAPLDYNNNLFEILRKFPKIVKIFLQEIGINALF